MLSIENVSYRIGNFVILDQVNAEIRQGDVVALIGANGAGKSTLADTISGFLRPSSGKISLNGSSLTGQPPADIGRQRVSRMFQRQHLAWNMSALENVLCGLDTQSEVSWRKNLFRTYRTASFENEKRERATDLLNRVGLGTKAEMPARNLSFGQQRLLALARSLAHRSDLLLLDEPFMGLKSAALDLTVKLLREELRCGRLLLIIDHSLSIVESIATKFWFMEKGRLTSFSSFASLSGSEMFVRSYLGFGPGEKLRAAETTTNQSCSDLEVSLSIVNSQRKPGRAEVSEVAPPMETDSSFASYIPPTLLALSSLSGGYGSRVIIRNLTLNLLRGDVFCLLGMNGSGKSTLLRLIAGIGKCFSGSISLDGEVIDHLRADERVHKGIRLLLQDHRLFRNLSVSENLLLTAFSEESASMASTGMPLSFAFTPSSTYTNVLRDMQSGISGHDRRLAGTLSGGEQSRVAVKQLGYGRSKLLLLDEPTAGIDGIRKSELITLVKSWKESGLAIVITEHDVDFVLSVATRVAILSDGELDELASVESLTPDRLLLHGS